MTNISSYKAVKWNSISSVFNQGTTIILGVLLMRLLEPEDFGLLGLVTILTGFLNIIKDSGLASSLIYKKNLTNHDTNTVFWFNLLIGFLLTIFLFFSSYPLSLYFEEERLAEIIKLYSIIFIFTSYTIVPIALLTKQLMFKQIFIADILSVLSSGILGLILALSDNGVWSLVFMHLSRAFVHLLLIWFLAPFRPRFYFSFLNLSNHFNYSLSVFGTKSFNYWTRNADNFFIGKSLGSEALGYYSRAYFFVAFPVQRISNVLGGVLFPVMSQKNYTVIDINRLLFRSIRTVALLTFPLMGLLYVSAEPLVLLAFGSRWSTMIPVLKIFSIQAMLESVLSLTTPVFYALGYTRTNFIISASQGCVNILLFYIGSLYSIELVAFLLLVSTILFTIPRVYYVKKYIRARLLYFVNSIKKTLIITLISILFVILSSLILLANNIQNMILFTLIFLLSYFVLSYFFSRAEYKELFQTFFLLLK